MGHGPDLRWFHGRAIEGPKGRDGSMAYNSDGTINFLHCHQLPCTSKIFFNITYYNLGN